MINVTKSFLPPREEYDKYLDKIWESSWLTNHGPLSLELEEKLKKYFDVKHLFFVANGTVALQIAIKALGLKDEVITTPFSFVATTSSVVWEGCTPVFADIEKYNLTINPKEIEKKITPKTTGIIATHVFGNPCDVEEIKKLSKKHSLPVIYDAAHAFGVKYKGESILNYGDISTLSFHATKLFHTIEGGAIVTNDDKLAHKISYMRNFGQEGPEKFWGIGINAKNSEFHAAMGLCILPKIDDIIRKRESACRLYDGLLGKNAGITRPTVREDTEYNFSYYPVIFESEKKLLEVQKALRENNIVPRRYFYPSLNSLDYCGGQYSPASEDISKRIMCLPLFYDLDEKNIRRIAGIINSVL